LLPVQDRPSDHRRRQELFIDGPLDTPRAFISCDRDDAVPYPNCSDTFLFHELLVQANYGKNFLPNWREVESQLSALLSRFTNSYR
jgi:hypothetical protein